jgi:hypothetical protein
MEYTMTNCRYRLTLLVCFVFAGCGKPPGVPDPELARRGTVEVTAKLVEVPEGAIFKRDLYDYAAVLKYDVTIVHRGDLKVGSTIYVGHYNPWKARADAADKKVKDVGGTLREFRAGERHRMALEADIEEHYLGGIVDKYFGQHEADTFWAVWTTSSN